jgi:hypothetical protein
MRLTISKVIKMQKKQTNFEIWVKEVTQTWKHIDSLKGKQAKRNLGILRIILESYHTLSMWDLALEYLKLTQPKFNIWEPQTVFYQRQKENAQMSRRLKFLLEKGYVRKEGSQYRLDFKGFFLLLILDPKLVREKGKYCMDDIMEDVGKDNLDSLDLSSLLQSGSKSDSWSKATSFADIFRDDAMAAAFSTFMKRRLFGWKVNLDEISKEGLVSVMMFHYAKAKSQKIKPK